MRCGIRSSCNLKLMFSQPITGVAKRVLPRFGEFCSCCCLPLLPQLAYSLLATWEALFWRPLYGAAPRPLMACSWFGEVRTCLLSKDRNKFHKTPYKPFGGARAQYVIYVMCVLRVQYLLYYLYKYCVYSIFIIFLCNEL